MKSGITSGAVDSTGGRRSVSRPQASGKFVLRLDPRLHAALRDDAQAAGVSLNDWCGRTLNVAAARDIARNTVAAVEPHAPTGPRS